MARLIIFVVAVAVLVAAAVWLANDPGAVSLTWHGWRVDTSVGVLIVTVMIAVIVIFLVLRLLAFIGGRVDAFTAARRARRLQRGLTSLGDGFAAAQAGQGQAARKLAREAATLLNDNPAVLLLRKDAADAAGDTDGMRAAAEEMLSRPQTELAGLRALAFAARKSGDTVGGLNHARRALARKDAPSWALSMVLDLEIAAGHWNEALTALDGKLARETFAPGELARLKSRLLALQAQTMLGHGDAAGATSAAKKAMDADENHVGAIVMYAKVMTAQGKGRKAAGAVERAWAAQPCPALLEAYRILVPGESALDWARRIDGLAKAAPDHPESRLAVAIASLRAELWGQARNRLAGLTGEDMAPDIRVRAAQLLAEVEERERGDSDKAAAWLQMALDLRGAAAHAAAKPKSIAELLALA
jgi:HemY protein